MNTDFPFIRQALSVFFAALAFGFSGCEEETKELVPTYEAGVLISSATTTPPANGNLSYYDRGTNTLEPDIFNKVNNQFLSGGVRSMTSAFDKMYLITDARQVEVLMANTLLLSGAIQEIEDPQRMVALNNQRGFISNWITTLPASGQVAAPDSGQVLEVNLRTLAVIDTIKTGKQPTAMALAGTRLFVANLAENRVNVINTTTNRVDTTLTVGAAPNSMVIDGAGFLWILCGGKSGADATKGQLVRVTPNNLLNKAVVFEFPNAATTPTSLTLSASRNRLYYLYNGVYQMDIAATGLPRNPLIPRALETVAQDPNDGFLYTSRTASTENWVIRYRSNGTVVDSFQVQGPPTGYHFR
ncbi:hypothetical protein EFA69_01505 [Rufibacter immobilis]|uniref:YncE family protein n=1 Tax=Rufibacter immobilis TaxID=1348778 RepID=A0A3M9N5P8_9BACT|nr:DUF5074 domain-containing protein [Rufibacter immobilis]RNI33124.1 hypothetical protein EFA69_01505 [Rufibacter immobilis]